mgnify:FL=1
MFSRATNLLFRGGVGRMEGGSIGSLLGFGTTWGLVFSQDSPAVRRMMELASASPEFERLRFLRLLVFHSHHSTENHLVLQAVLRSDIFP